MTRIPLYENFGPALTTDLQREAGGLYTHHFGSFTLGNHVCSRQLEAPSPIERTLAAPFIRALAKLQDERVVLANAFAFEV